MRKFISFLCIICCAINTNNAQATRSIDKSPTRINTKNISITTRQQSQTSSRNAHSRNATKPSLNTRKAQISTPLQHATTKKNTNTVSSTKKITARSTQQAVTTSTFNTDYDTCHDAYFTCMDQFCATQNEDYRRCICSSRLTEIQQKQQAISDTSASIQSFKSINLDVVTKTKSEVEAMLSETQSEQILSKQQDKSSSSQQLSNIISNVLSNTKTKNSSNNTPLDITQNINSIWLTNDFANGTDIANLTGENLYNAVHTQCANLVIQQCPNSSTFNMVVSAYGMYIENDCTTLSTALSKQKNSTTAAIRETKQEMQSARLENYNSHNSLSVNECIASIRKDITADTACGSNYVHCLDVTGLYLNYETGEPIYTPQFYKLENQISLSDDTLTNKYNRELVAELNKKKTFANISLDKCRDSSENIWNEFMRQAIVEIYQAQQERIRQVKTECLDIVNTCYDEKTSSLKDFNNVDSSTLLGMTLETVEDLCEKKLTTCSNLYGKGSNGMQELLNAMHNITNQRIASECQNLLKDYAQDICSNSASDTLHAYPYTCRTYNPGSETYAKMDICNKASPDANCPTNYLNSLYRKFAQYALQMCMRPSEYDSNNGLSYEVLQDLDIVMSQVKTSMSTELSKECERLGGIWFTNPYDSTSSTDLLQSFYTETSSDKNWGYCADANGTYIITLMNDIDTGKYERISAKYNSVLSTVTPIPEKNYIDDKYYAFRGYYTEPNGKGIQYYDSKGWPVRKWDLAENTILYAYWEKCLHIQLSTGEAELNNQVPTAPTPNTLYFVDKVGWYSDAQCKNEIYQLTGTPHATIGSTHFTGYVTWIGPSWEEGGHSGNFVIDANGALMTSTEAMTTLQTTEDNWDIPIFCRFE